jgi:hypothetical protein
MHVLLDSPTIWADRLVHGNTIELDGPAKMSPLSGHTPGLCSAFALPLSLVARKHLPLACRPRLSLLGKVTGHFLCLVLFDLKEGVVLEQTP